jgi:magnesium-transporting ATPase (P-type)
MIQRKQTIYLFFAGLVTLVLLFIPFGIFQIEDVTCFEYKAFSVNSITEKEVIVNTTGNALLLIATSLLSFITIFFYQNRRLQIKLISINMLVILLAIFTILYIYPNFVFPKNPNFYDATLKYEYTFLICFIPPAGLYLAKKAIARDEALVRSADRLR